MRDLAEDIAAAAIDEVYGAAMGATQRSAREPVAPLQGIVGGADHRHGGWGEERLEVAPRRRARCAGLSRAMHRRA
jgi:hypothetical protein